MGLGVQIQSKDDINIRKNVFHLRNRPYSETCCISHTYNEHRNLYQNCETCKPWDSGSGPMIMVHGSYPIHLCKQTGWIDIDLKTVIG